MLKQRMICEQVVDAQVKIQNIKEIHAGKHQATSYEVEHCLVTHCLLISSSIKAAPFLSYSNRV